MLNPHLEEQHYEGHRRRVKNCQCYQLILLRSSWKICNLTNCLNLAFYLWPFERIVGNTGHKLFMYIMSRPFERFGFENDPWVHGRNLKEKMCISWNWLSSLDFSTFCILIILKGYCVTLKYPGTTYVDLPPSQG